MGATNEDLEDVAARISGELGIERDSKETPLQFLQRFAAAAKSFTAAVIERADEKVQEVGKQLEAVAKQRDELAADARLGNELVEALLPHAGERGNDEGAVEALQRIISERDQARSELDAVKASGAGVTGSNVGASNAGNNAAPDAGTTPPASGDGKAEANKSKPKTK